MRSKMRIGLRGMTAAPATVREAEAKAHDTVIGILEFAGLHRCHKAPPDRPTFCGCAPGRCVQEEG